MSHIHLAMPANAFAYRTRQGDVIPGVASHAGALLGNGDAIDILLEEPVAPPGGHLDIEYDDFRASQDPLRRRNPEALIAVDVRGDQPKLWLNSGVTNLVEIVGSRARRGANARIREATYQSIAAQVWTVLIAASVEALRAAIADGLEGRAALDEIIEWKKRVVHYWAPRIYSWISDRDQAVDALVAAAASADGLVEVHEATVVALQRYTNARSAFDGLIRLVTREGV
jgi:hypothetical protein